MAALASRRRRLQTSGQAVSTKRPRLDIDHQAKSKLVVSMPIDLFNEMQAWCHVRGVTMTEFVRQATTEKLGKDQPI